MLLPRFVTIAGYVGAVSTLSWLTIANHLGDWIYGAILMIGLAFPLALFGGTHVIQALGIGGDFLVYAWPGFVTALILSLMFAWKHTRTAARVFAALLASVAVLEALVITFDQWAPRRPYGWPLAVWGVVMGAGLVAERRRLTLR